MWVELLRWGAVERKLSTYSAYAGSRNKFRPGRLAGALDSGLRIRNSGVKGKTQKVATQTGDEAMEKLKKILDKCRCPACGSEKLVPAMGKVVCDECKMRVS